MHPRHIAIVALLIPVLASAQRGGGGRGGFGRDERPDFGSGSTSTLQLSNRDVEDISPIKLLIDKRKDLKLADDKVKQLKDLESQMKTKLEPSFKALDSLRRDMRVSAKPSEEERAKMMNARGSVPTVVTEIRGIYDATLKDVMSLLDEAQQKTANELVEKQRSEAEEMLKEKLGGGRGGRRG